MPLHTDYRPDDFEEFEGNAAVISSLRSKLEGDDPPHAFLFTGPSGCGKTTLGRLVAISLGALKQGQDPEKAPNYRELDAADFRGIDTVREIRRTMRLSPLGGADRSRVYLLDECHQLTKDAQEALLKALEDTPPHVYFVLATTEPQKLKPTLKRRCMSYDLKPLTGGEMSAFLLDIADCEGKKIDEKVLDLIVEKAEGSPGRALVALDEVIDLKPDEAEEVVKTSEQMNREVIDLCRALIGKKKWPVIAGLLSNLKQQGQEPERIRLAIFGYCTAILLKGEKNSRAYLVMDSFREPIFDGTGFNKLVLYSYESLYAE